MEETVVDRDNWSNAGYYVECIQSCIFESIPSISPVHHCLFLLTVPQVTSGRGTSNSISSSLLSQLNFNSNYNFNINTSSFSMILCCDLSG